VILGKLLSDALEDLSGLLEEAPHIGPYELLEQLGLGAGEPLVLLSLVTRFLRQE
jgi:hypothetical protein